MKYLTLLLILTGCTSTPHPNYEDSLESDCFQGAWYYRYSKYIYVQVIDEESGEPVECNEP